jgi:hypothetical protein
MASSLYRLLAKQVGGTYDHAQAKTLFNNLLDVSATVEIDAKHVVVTLEKHSHNPFLAKAGLAEDPTLMPWFGDKRLVLRFA